MPNQFREGIPFGHGICSGSEGELWGRILEAKVGSSKEGGRELSSQIKTSLKRNKPKKHTLVITDSSTYYLVKNIVTY